MSKSQTVSLLVSTFVEDLTDVIENAARDRVLTALSDGIVVTKRGPGRPPASAAPAKPKAARRKGPIQLCPAPGCKNRAAPVFGMVCSAHKDAPKAKIKAWREARRAKATGKPVAKIKAKPAKKSKAKTKPAKKIKTKPAKKLPTAKAKAKSVAPKKETAQTAQA